MTGTEKEALRRAGVTTIQALATLKDFAPPAKPISPPHQAVRPRLSRSPPPGLLVPGWMN